jgi:SlyX protein
MKTESERVTDLEIQLAHLQRQFDVLNEVVTQQTKQLDQSSKRIDKLVGTIEELKANTELISETVDEKPPHY